MNKRHFNHFNIAGFTYYEGVEVFHELKIGTVLTAVAEPANQFDAYAVMLFYKDVKLGYIPRDSNKEVFKFLSCGHNELFEFRINRVDDKATPENQIGVVAKIMPKGA